jgi:hypothetical protein
MSRMQLQWHSELTDPSNLPWGSVIYCEYLRYFIQQQEGFVAVHALSVVQQLNALLLCHIYMPFHLHVSWQKEKYFASPLKIVSKVFLLIALLNSCFIRMTYSEFLRYKKWVRCITLA